MFRHLAAAYLALAAFTFGCDAGAEQPTVITIATAERGGAYLPAGNAICRFVNSERDRHGLLCLATPSSGSVENIGALLVGERAYAIVQSDVEYAAYMGSGRFRGGEPFRQLRSLFSLYLEPFTVVARRDAQIRHLGDLEGHRFNLGREGSGMRATAENIMSAFGWTLDSFSATGDLSPGDQLEALCSGEIDAGSFTVGHPSGWIHDALSACDAVLVPVDGPVIDRLLAAAPYYTTAVLRGGTYAAQFDDVPTIAVRATLVTVADRPEEEVYQVVKAVFSNLETLRLLHPALEEIDARTMVQAHHTAPLHPGAERYYRETGLSP